MTDKTIVAFDGEGIDKKYILLAHSPLVNITHPCIINRRDGLSMLECVQFLAKLQFCNTLNIWFSFDYDVNMIFKSIADPAFWRGDRALKFLIRRKVYRVRYLAGRRLDIWHGERRITHYDLFKFFDCSFERAIAKHLGVQHDPVIAAGKQARADFSKWTNADIVNYNRAELDQLVLLAGCVVDAIESMPLHGAHIRSYHGPGAIGGAIARSAGLTTELRDSIAPVDLDWLADRAFFGHRFELIRRGLFRGIWHGDLRSAYPFGMLELPDLSRSRWHRVDRFVPGAIGCYAVLWRCAADTRIGPLPFRQPNNRAVLWPIGGAAAAWHYEIEAAIGAGVDVQIVAGWVCDDPRPSCLQSMILDLYAQRAEWRAASDPREAIAKHIMNSIYGKIAQRPSTGHGGLRSMILAGMITSRIRAEVYRVAMQDPDNVIAFAADALYARSLREVAIGDGIGQWDVEIVSRGTFLQTGFYRLVRTDGSESIASRGFRGAEIDFDRIERELRGHGYSDLKVRRFVNKMLALTNPLRFDDIGWYAIDKRLSAEHDYKRRWFARYGVCGYDESLPRSAAFGFSAPYVPKPFDYMADPILIDEW